MKLCIGVALSLLVFLFGCNKDPIKEAAQTSSGSINSSTKTQQVSPSGVRVYSKNGVSENFLRKADIGIGRTMEDAVASGYAPRTSPQYDFGYYDIRIPDLPCVRSPVYGAMSFLMNGTAEYDGTEFDYHNTQGSYIPPITVNGKILHHKPDGTSVIYVAELIETLGTSGERVSMFVCNDEGIVEEAVKNGSEHSFAAAFNTEYFNRTWSHAGGFNHPLLPERAGLSPEPVIPPTAGQRVIVVAK
jgi:hypothetical protein